MQQFREESIENWSKLSKEELEAMVKDTREVIDRLHHSDDGWRYLHIAYFENQIDTILYTMGKMSA